MSIWDASRGKPRPADAYNAMRRAALKEVEDNAEKAMALVAAGPDPANTGDFILVGGHGILLERVAVRLTPAQALGLVHQMIGLMIANMGPTNPPGGGEPAAGSADEPVRKVG